MSPEPLEQKLLDSILADPDADGPRLVYADWLMQRGDPRGAFIRDQCLLASLDSSDPRYSDLYRATSRQIHTQREAWMRRLWPDAPNHKPPYSVEIQLARGLPRRIWTNSAGAMDLARLCTLAPLRSMHVLQGSGFDLSFLLHQALEAGLDDLSVFAYGSLSLSTRTVAGIERLKGLGVAGAFDVPSEILISLLGAADLRRLALEDVRLGDQKLGRLVDAGVLDRIEVLELENASLAAASLRHLSAIRSESAHDRPLSLSLLRNPAIGASYHRWLEGSRVKALAIGSRESHSVRLDPQALSELKHLELLGFSSLQGSRLGDIPFSSLSSLSITHCRLDRDELNAIARSGLLENLLGLSLEGSLNGDSDLIRLLEGLPAGRLCSLDLSACKLSTRGLEALARWPGLPGLVELDLGGVSEVRGPWIEALARAPGFEPALLGLGYLKPPKQLLVERFGRAVVGSLPKSAVLGPFGALRRAFLQ